MISKGKISNDYNKLRSLDEASIAAYYFNLTKIPCLISSPLREDKHPSFTFYLYNNEVNFRDFANNQSGNIWTLLKKYWNCSYNKAAAKVLEDFDKIKDKNHIKSYDCSKGTSSEVRLKRHVILKCKIRELKDYDIKYWNTYGITPEWLKFGNVWPISHRITITEDNSQTYQCDKYAYTFAEFKDNRCTLKIYQPFNTEGYKWISSHDKSVISLWTKLPLKGERVCICSSLKDALCLWANMGIPSIAPQGEGIFLSQKVITQLKERFNNIFICFDNDPPGIEYAKVLTSKTGFTNIVIPSFDGGKDISDLYKVGGKNYFVKIFKKLFNK